MFDYQVKVEIQSNKAWPGLGSKLNVTQKQKGREGGRGRHKAVVIKILQFATQEVSGETSESYDWGDSINLFFVFTWK